MPFIDLVTMKLDEARKFLGIGGSMEDRDKLATECATRFLGEGVKICVLNDSENGSYMVHADKKYPYHVSPFPRQPIEEMVSARNSKVVENFSGCGDGIFSTLLYASEVYPEVVLEDRLIIANSVARLISLLPESNLYGVDGKILKQVFGISKNIQ